MEKYAIVVAGGSGSRMQSATPKQFIELLGKPIIIHTLETYFNAIPGLKCIVVLPKEYLEEGKKMVEKWLPAFPVSLVTGGKERFHSVKNGLDLISSEGIVAIHDAVRPLVRPEVIYRSFQVAEKAGSAIVTVPLKDSIRWVKETENRAMNRADFHLVQTPQTFRVSEIKDAYLKISFDASITDDASVYEKWGKAVTLVEGNYENIKITTPEDLIVAEALLLRKEAGK